MTLPVKAGYAPMDARVVGEIPAGTEWQYEPKWDGFRCLAFRDGPKVVLMSKSGQPLTRYFPELVDALAAVKAKQFVIDGEIVIELDGALSFDALLQRIHPAQSRIDRLATETPATFLLFDLLVDAKGNDLSAESLTVRRPQLERFVKSNLSPRGSLRLSPATQKLAEAQAWLNGREGTDGVIAKRTDMPYASGLRTAMVKIKRKRSVDCVVGGFRYASKGRVVGSLLLGLYDSDGMLHHVGFTSSFTADERKVLTPRIEKLKGGEGFTGRAPGGPSRWSTKRSSEWEPLKPKLVVEVEYDHFTNGRFRHGTKLLRWRPDKAPAQCLMSQVAESRTGDAPVAPPAPKKKALKKKALKEKALKKTATDTATRKTVTRKKTATKGRRRSATPERSRRRKSSSPR